MKVVLPGSARFALVIAIGLSGFLRADTYTWDAGGGADTNWTTAVNWAPGDVVPLATDDAVFTGATARTVCIATGDQGINSLTVTGTAAWTWTTNTSGNKLSLAGRFLYGGSGNSTFRGPIDSAGDLLVTNGYLTLLSSNNFAGGVGLTGGQLRVGNNWATGTNTLTLGNGVLGPVAGINITNYNPLVLAGNTTFGYDQMGSRTLWMRGNALLTGNRTLYSYSDSTPDSINAQFDGVIDDGVATNSITWAGSSRLTLAVNNLFKGGLTVTGGIVDVGADQSIGPGTLTLGTVAFASSFGSRMITNAMTLAGDANFSFGGSGIRSHWFDGPILLTGNRSLSVYSDNNHYSTVDFRGPLSDCGSGYRLTKIKTGRLLLSGTNSLGGLTVQAGELALCGVNSCPGDVRTELTGALLFSNSNAIAVGDLIFAGGAAHVLGNDYTVTNRVKAPYPFLIATPNAGTAQKTLTLAGPVDLSGDTRVYTYRYLNDSAARPLAIQGNISDGAEFYALRKTGYAGDTLLTLSGTNTFDGGIISDSGTLKMTGDNTGVNGGIVLSHGTLQGVARASGLPFGTNAIVLNQSSATLELDAVNGIADTALGEVIFRQSSPLLYVLGVAGGGSWTAAKLTRDGRGGLIFRGTGTSPYPLTTNDKFMLTTPPAVVNGIIAPFFQEATGDFLTYNAGGRGIERTTAYIGGDINTNAATAIYNAAANQTLTAAREVYAFRTGSDIDGAFDLTVGSGGVLLYNNYKTVACNLQFNNQEGILGVYSDSRYWTTNSGVIKGTAGVTKLGGGTLMLTTPAAYSGPTTINAGQVTLGVSQALPTNTVLTITGGTLDLYGFDQTIAGLTVGRANLCNRRRVAGMNSTLNVSGTIRYNGQSALSSAANAMSAALLYAGPDEDSTTNALTVNFVGPITFDIADGPQTPDLGIGGKWYMDSDNDYYVSVSGTGTTPLTKKGPGLLQFRNRAKNTFTGDITIEEGTFLGWSEGVGDAAPFGNAANNVFLLRNGAISYGGGTISTSTLASATFAGGNKWCLGLGNNTDINLASLVRAGGSRGTLLLFGTATQYNNYDNFGRLYVNGWKTPNADPDENDMTSPIFVHAGQGTDVGQANFCKVNNTSGRISSFGNGDPGYTTTFPASPVGTEKVYLGAVATQTVDKAVWALRTAMNVIETADTTITLGSGGLILNGDLTFAPKLRFGASGTREALVYVAGADYPYMHTAVLSDQLITTGGLTKFGDGILTLAADSSGTLSGTHWINQGTLRLSNAAVFAASAEVNIERGAVLGLAGNYTLGHAFKGLGSITTGTNLLVATGSISPGFGVGTLTVEDLDFRGTYNWEWDGTNSDTVACITLVFGGATPLDLNASYVGSGTSPAGVYTLFTYKGSAPTLPAWNITLPRSRNGKVSLDAPNQRVIMTITPAPPGTAMLFR